jgi:hypothetical protein
MIPLSAPLVRCLCLLTTLAAWVPLSASPLDEAIQVEVQRAQIGLERETPEFATFKLGFDLRLTNRSENPVSIPERESGPDGASWKTLLSMQSQQKDGSWKFLISPGQLVWKGDTKFVLCKSLRPKETLEIRNVSNIVGVFKTELAGLDPRPTVRIDFVLTCRQQDGQVLVKNVVTEPFVLTYQPDHERN